MYVFSGLKVGIQGVFDAINNPKFGDVLILKVCDIFHGC